MTSSLTADQVDAAKMAALEKFMKSASKAHGTSIAALNDASHVDVEAIPTGALILDHATAIGGIPRGRVTELFGPPGSGKTTVSLEAARNCQDAGGLVGFVDAENALNRQLTESIGIHEDRFIIAQPDYGEQGIAIAREMIESNVFDMVIIDSAAALVPKAELEAEVEQQHMGLQARLLSKGMRILTHAASVHNVALVIINQVRTNLQKYGAPMESSGGVAIKFAASMRIEVRTSPSKAIKNGADIIGAEVTATVKKNKFASPSKPVEFKIMHGKGIDRAEGVLSVANDLGIVERQGNTYMLLAKGANLEPVEVKLGVGRQKANDALLADPELFAAVEAAVKVRMSGPTEPSAEDGRADEASIAEPSTRQMTPPAAPAPDANEQDPFGLGV